MKRLVILCIITFLGILSAEKATAQMDYKFAGGVRFAGFYGLTGKYALKENAAIEGIISFPWDGLMITGLYEFTGNIAAIEEFNYYVGGGVVLGNQPKLQPHPVFRTEERGAYIGAAVIGGVEYTFTSLPVNLSLDWKPFFTLIPASYFASADIALSIRYTFKGDK